MVHSPWQKPQDKDKVEGPGIGQCLGPKGTHQGEEKAEPRDPASTEAVWDVPEGEGTAEEKGAPVWEGPTPGRTAAGQTLSRAA